jgi:hypothetical protein
MNILKKISMSYTDGQGFDTGTKFYYEYDFGTNNLD